MEKKKFDIRSIIFDFKKADIIGTYGLNSDTKRTACYAARNKKVLVTVWTNEYKKDGDFETPIIKKEESVNVSIDQDIYKGNTLEDMLASLNGGEFAISQDRNHPNLLKIACRDTAKVLDTDEKGKPTFRYTATADIYVDVPKYFDPMTIIRKIESESPAYFTWTHDDFKDKLVIGNIGFNFINMVINAILSEEQW